MPQLAPQPHPLSGHPIDRRDEEESLLWETSKSHKRPPIQGCVSYSLNFFLSFWRPVDFPDHGRLFTFLAMADALRLLGSPGPWEREALSYYHHSLILDTVHPPYDNDVFIAGQGIELARMIMSYNFNHFFTLLPTSFIHLYSMFLEVSSN